MDTTLALLVYGGLIFKSVGFFLRDELSLRVLVLCGMAMDLAFQTQLPQSFAPSLVSITILITINVSLILVILWERTRWLMSDADRQLYVYFPTLTPGQFRAVLRTAVRFVTSKPDRRLIQEDTQPDMLYFIFADQFTVQKQEARFVAHGPSFAGEIAFLTKCPSSASIHVPKGTAVVGFELARLTRLMARKPDIANGLIALFGQDMARKLSRSAPFVSHSDDPTSPTTNSQVAPFNSP